MEYNGIVEEGRAPDRGSLDDRGGLVSWVMAYVQRNRIARDSAYKARWDDYYAIWRGKWTPSMRNRASERSKLISPATQMSVDIMVAEIEEALLGREAWFDIADDIEDDQKEDALKARDLLMQDLFEDGVITFLAKTIISGALYGQLHGKIAVEVKEEAQPVRIRTPDGKSKVIRAFRERPHIYPVALEPGQVVWDTSGPTHIDDMLGVAHEFRMGLHKIQERQAKGVYYNVPVHADNTEYSTESRHEGDISKSSEDAAFITEYHGLVPSRMLTRLNLREGDTFGASLLEKDDGMVEAIVTIANEGTLLRAISNPSIMEDRAVVGAQFDTVANSYMGRGLVEKAYNAQKALDLELRARADALAWRNNPMMAADITRLPPKQDLNVWPGKVWNTRGNPKEILQEFSFGDVNASTFQQTQEYERMVSQATGAMDPANLRQGIRDESSTGAGIAASGLIKRSKRTMFNIEVFLNTLLRRIMWRKMQFDPERYPTDYKFVVKGTIGIIAREVEMQHMAQLLQYAPEGSPPHMILLKSIFDQSASPNKAEMRQAVEAWMKPDPKKQQMQELMQQLALAEQEAKVNKLRAETAKALADAGASGADSMLKQIEMQIKADDQRLERIRVAINAQEAEAFAKQVDLQGQKNQLEAARLFIDARKPAAKK